MGPSFPACLQRLVFPRPRTQKLFPFQPPTKAGGLFTFNQARLEKGTFILFYPLYRSCLTKRRPEAVLRPSTWLQCLPVKKDLHDLGKNKHVQPHLVAPQRPETNQTSSNKHYAMLCSQTSSKGVEKFSNHTRYKETQTRLVPKPETMGELFLPRESVGSFMVQRHGIERNRMELVTTYSGLVWRGCFGLGCANELA